MADQQHLAILRGGVHDWNAWRAAHPDTRPDLSAERHGSDGFEDDLNALITGVLNQVVPGRAPTDRTELTGADLNQIDLRGADLRGARLDGSMLIEADLTDADLRDASLTGCVLTSATLVRADAQNADMGAATLRWADVTDATLRGTRLRMANADEMTGRRVDLREADLVHARLVAADLAGADLTGAAVYGVSAWEVDLTDARQDGLVITRPSEPQVTVDDLQIAQFLHLIIANQTIRAAIDVLATKVVLILGRFTPRRKEVLLAVRDALRDRGYVPVIFDFERPASRDFTETIATLAHLARFIVADLTDPASLPKELEAIVPRLAVPVVPLLERGASLYAMFDDYWKYDWVLGLVEYRTVAGLLRSFDKTICRPAERAADDLSERRGAAGAHRRGPRGAGR
ncbi:pentapeptide repeat-containing protein [Actinomycetospora aeridis]|uniref:Pentapeptide repeat-containing protein n=1 Tax=Actinomycetospora aeridis TaxID=3129231 RepID=A0ABU8MYK6_9PSEU